MTDQPLVDSPLTVIPYAMKQEGRSTNTLIRLVILAGLINASVIALQCGAQLWESRLYVPSGPLPETIGLMTVIVQSVISIAVVFGLSTVLSGRRHRNWVIWAIAFATMCSVWRTILATVMMWQLQRTNPATFISSRIGGLATSVVTPSLVIWTLIERRAGRLPQQAMDNGRVLS